MTHYILISSLLEPVLLDPGESYTLGRSAENRIVLDSHRISRVHAKVYWEKDHFVLWDQGSRNGSVLNEVPLEPGEVHPLKDKDIIGLDPYILRFRQVEGDLDLILSLEIERLKLDRLEYSLKNLKENRSFQGSLLYFRLSYLLQILEGIEKSGSLELRTQKNKEGTLFLNQGKIISAESSSLRRLEAVEVLFALKEGYFTFTTMTPSQEQTIFMSTSQLMLKFFSILHPVYFASQNTSS
ncbi:MAG: FHA domain-containing protein [Planctomycetota bacterium]